MCELGEPLRKWKWTWILGVHRREERTEKHGLMELKGYGISAGEVPRGFFRETLAGGTSGSLLANEFGANFGGHPVDDDDVRVLTRRALFRRSANTSQWLHLKIITARGNEEKSLQNRLFWTRDCVRLVKRFGVKGFSAARRAGQDELGRRHIRLDGSIHVDRSSKSADALARGSNFRGLSCGNHEFIDDARIAFG